MKNLDVSNLSLATFENYLSIYGLQIIGALAIFVIGRLVAGLIRKVIRKVMTKSHVDPTLIAFVSNVLYIIMLILVTISAISNIGVNTNSLAAMIGAAGLAIGLAFQSSLSNVAAGIILILLRPFRVGHEIVTNDVEGVVEEIDIMMTSIRTSDNRRVTIPNNLILNAKLINNNINDTRRIAISFGISYGDDVAKAKDIISEIIKGDDRVIAEKPVFIGVTQLSETRVIMAVRVWVNTPNFDAVQNNLFEKISTALNKQGFTMQAPGYLPKASTPS